MADLFNRLPSKLYSFPHFIRTAKKLESKTRNPDPEVADPATREFVNLMLTGRYESRGHQADVNPTIGMGIRGGEQIFMTRDFDSLLGISDDILVQSEIFVYPVSNPADTLHTSIHMKYAFRQGARTSYVPYHRIPNLQLGIFGQRHMIHLFFPSLYSDGRQAGPYLTTDERRELYELGLRPAIDNLVPLDGNDWPATYDGELFRARKQSGAMAYQTKMLQSFAVPLLVPTIREMLWENGIAWARDCFVLHTVRGTKNGTKHSLEYPGPSVALDTFLLNISLPANVILTTGEWYIDIGVEYASSLGNCLQWRTTSHFHFVKEVLHIPDADAQRITSLSSSQYQRDISSHLPSVSGCRIEPGARAMGPFAAVYYQQYTNDKSLIYNPEKQHHGKAISMKDAMGKKQPAQFMLDLYKLYVEARRKNSSNARVEVRVPFAHANTILLDVNPNVVEDSLLSFERQDWWEFRCYRLLAFGRILASQAEGSPALRVKPEALLLTAACVWLTNSLHARPDDGSAARCLMEAILPLTDADDPDPLVIAYHPRGGHNPEYNGHEDEETIVPYFPYGIIFLRRIMLENIPRMRAGGGYLTPAAFKYHFGATEEAIVHQYYRVGFIPPEAIAQRRGPSNKCKRTPTFTSEPGTSLPVLFSLSERGLQLPPPPIDTSSDLEEEEDGNGDQDINESITQLFRQFTVDMLHKVPKPAGVATAPYCILDSQARLTAAEDVYKNTQLSDIWRQCQYKLASKEDVDLAFNHLFPPPGHVTGKVQNYTQCQYYIKWKEICQTTDEKTVKAIRQDIRKRVAQFSWLPHACQDKMWATKHLNSFKRFPTGSTGPAPRIIFLHGRPLLDT